MSVDKDDIKPIELDLLVLLNEHKHLQVGRMEATADVAEVLKDRYNYKKIVTTLYYLEKAGLVSKPRKGVYRITPAGSNIVHSLVGAPDHLDKEQVEAIEAGLTERDLSVASLSRKESERPEGDWRPRRFVKDPETDEYEIASD